MKKVVNFAEMMKHLQVIGDTEHHQLKTLEKLAISKVQIKAQTNKIEDEQKSNEENTENAERLQLKNLEKLAISKVQIKAQTNKIEDEQKSKGRAEKTKPKSRSSSSLLLSDVKAGKTRPQSTIFPSSDKGFHHASNRDQLKNLTSQSLVNSFTNLNIRRSKSSRKHLENLQDVAELIVRGEVRKIVVMVGAGISTPSGIPDFRTPGTGLYDNLQQYNIPHAEAIFDIDFFRDNPRPFFALAKELYPTGKYLPNAVHYFLLELNRRGILQRIYTQNIDGLERLSGIPVDKLVEAHGSFYSASCIDCRRSQEIEDVKATIFAGKIPLCKQHDCQGFVKPDIVFFGEDLPSRFFMYRKDFSQADLLLVMGTSLKVEPFASIVDSVRFQVPRLLFNFNRVGPFRQRKSRINDVVATGDIVNSVRQFVESLGWVKEFDELLVNNSILPQPAHYSAVAATVAGDAATAADGGVRGATRTACGEQLISSVGTTDSRRPDVRRLPVALKQSNKSRPTQLPPLKRNLIGKEPSKTRPSSSSSSSSSSELSSESS